MRLMAWQRAWVEEALAPGVRVAALSTPRGCGKTFLASWLCAEALTPGTSLFHPRAETVIVSASMEQSRTLFGSIQDELDDRGSLQKYRFIDSNQRLGITGPEGVKLRAISSDPKRAMGLSRFTLIVGDEPACWPDRQGELMYHALRQAIGKRIGQRLILVGTRSPARPGSWWPSLLDHGVGNGVVVRCVSAPGDAPWDDFATIRKANPLYARSAALRAVLRAERDEARRNPAMRPAFEAYRLNRLVDVRQHVLLRVDQQTIVFAREAPPRVGRPVLGIDLGGSRSWSAAWAQWQNGRAEVLVLAPGVPDLTEVERQDSMPRGLYTNLQKAGVLHVDIGLRQARPSQLIKLIWEAGWRPRYAVADLMHPLIFAGIRSRRRSLDTPAVP